jgi:neutral ceramidase
MEKLYVGRSRVDITPTKLPVLVNGQFEERRFDKIGDPLSARAIAFRQGDECALLAVVDTCMMSDSFIDGVKVLINRATAIPENRMMISATHCHSAPSVQAILGTGVDEEYAAFLPEKIVEAAQKAYENLIEVEAGFGEGEDTQNVFCRRFIMKPGTAWTVDTAFTGSPGDIAQMNPFGIEKDIVCPTDKADPGVRILAFRTFDGLPYSLLGNYSTHYAEEEAVSADYFGVFCDCVAQGLNAPEGFTALMSNGTSGDCNCIDFAGNPERKFDKNSVGRSVARVALEAYRDIQFDPAPRLAMIEEKITLGIRQPTESQLRQAEAYLKAREINSIRDLKNYNDAYAWESVVLSKLAPVRQVKIQTLRIADTAIVALPMEVYTATGREIRFMSPFPHTIVISMANGYNGYMPTEESFRLGGYTTWRARSSCLEPLAERKVRRLVYRMLNRLAEAKK